MPDELDAPASGLLRESLADRLSGHAPPPMPVARAVASAVKPAEPAAPATQPDQAPAATPVQGGWEIDEDSFNSFTSTIELVRGRLLRVRDQIDRMWLDSYTPKLGTSPVAEQLEQKFADRLDAPLDDQHNPTSGGLRPMLDEAMRRMEEFLIGAEAAARDYQELDESATTQVKKAGKDG